MPTWINHFIVADKIIDRIKNIDKEYFIIGSIAPDCGKQTAPHGIYNPPTGETHFTKDYEYSRKTDCDYNYVFNNYVKGEKDIKKYSFFLGYYIHLFVDRFFANEVFVPIENKYGLFRENEELSRTVKKEKNNIDFLYVKNHTSPTLELFYTYDGFNENYPKWYKNGQITWQMENIKSLYKNCEGAEMEYKYLTPADMEKFHERVFAALLNELEEKRIL
ncbi:MAG: zinc dependent phospholipase C family protein [Eubacterium sp.]|nr:zinc dependent phospholipase C family protein [Eubacterium sp.]